MDAWSQFIFLYPVVMSIIWMTGSWYFAYRYEGAGLTYPVLAEYPFVSVVIPVHNEERHLAETVEALIASDYPELEIIIVDDGSTDATPTIASQLIASYANVRLLTLSANMGKAAALNYSVLLTQGEIIVTIDGDCLLEPQALHWLVQHFVRYPRVGAVTGNPRVRNRTTLLAKLQAAEYASVIGLIKRTQRILGKIMTVSGVIAAFRKRAIIDCGLWTTDMVTDDIDITWKLEKRFWAVHYELNAVGWILVPETLRGLWSQRLRWAQGGVEVLRRHRNVFSDWRCRRLWPIYFDYLFSIVWAFSFLTYAGLSLIKSDLPMPAWTGSIIAFICLSQFLLSFYLDWRYDKSLYKTYFWIIWYPVVYWIFNSVALVVATPQALFKQWGKNATWISPDRGLEDMGSR